MLLFLLVVFSSLALTYFIRRYALTHNVLDIPNQRSSHSQPTPRGGGLAIVLSYALAVFLVFLDHEISNLKLGALAATLCIAWIGFVDDHRPVAASRRILVHFFSAFLALWCLDISFNTFGPETLSQFLNHYPAAVQLSGFLLAALLIVWFLNLFNFMDGIDGIAASEAIFVACGLAAFVYPLDAGLSKIALLLAAACCGFLYWNWPKAKIFMGDVGSGFLGMALALLILMAAQIYPAMLCCGLILYGLFIVDASYTLIVRILSGQKWHEAHCSHCYQIAAKRFGHQPVVLGCWLINLCWLLPLAALAYYQPGFALPALLIAYAPLLWLAHRYRAGRLRSAS